MRALRMIEIASVGVPARQVQYIGIDPFEDRTPDDGPGLSLKEAHRLLARTGARIQLLPGDPATALARAANSLKNVDLVVISAGPNVAELAPMWFYFPRMLHAGSVVLVEEKQGSELAFRQLTLVEIRHMAAPAGRRAA
jgi:hypothetical protein